MACPNSHSWPKPHLQADLLYQRYKKLREDFSDLGEPEGTSGALEFGQLILEIAAKNFKDLEPEDAFEALMEQIVEGYPEIAE